MSRSHGSAPRSIPASLSLPPSMRPGTGLPLPPLGREGKRRRGGRESSRRLLFSVVDVPVIFNDKFQQSKSYMFSKEPQLQFIDRVLDLLVVQRRRGTHSATVQKTDSIPRPCCATTDAWFDGAANCGCPAVAVHRRSSTSLSCRRVRSHGPVCSEDHRGSSGAVRCQEVDALVVQVVFHARCCARQVLRPSSSEEGRFCSILLHFSHSVQLDVSAHFQPSMANNCWLSRAPGWRGRRESDSQVLPP